MSALGRTSRAELNRAGRKDMPGSAVAPSSTRLSLAFLDYETVAVIDGEVSGGNGSLSTQ